MGWKEREKMERLEEKFIRWILGVEWRTLRYMVREETQREKLRRKAGRRAWMFEKRLEEGRGSDIERRCLEEMKERGRQVVKNCNHKGPNKLLLQISINSVCNIVISKAAKEEKQLNSEAGYPENKFSVSGDGSWSKKSFSFLLGIVSLIGKHSNKILDIVVKSNMCKAYKFWKGKENTVDFEAWYLDHKKECQANYKSNANKMEVDGIVEIFQQSIEKHGKEPQHIYCPEGKDS